MSRERLDNAKRDARCIAALAVFAATHGVVAPARATAHHDDARDEAVTHNSTEQVEGEISDLWAEALVERFAFDGGKLVVSEAPGSPAVAVCVATDRRSDEPDGDPSESTLAERRGGVIDVASTTYAKTWCATLPSTELAFGLWLAERHALNEATDPSAVGAAANGAQSTSERRLTALALEGTTLVDASAPASTVVGVSGGVATSDVVTAFEKLFRKRTKPADLVRHSLAPNQSSERLSVMEGPVPAPRARYGWMVGGDDSKQRAAIAVAFEVLAGSASSRLERDLVVRRLIAHRVSAWESAVLGGDVIGIELEISTRASLDRARRFVDGSIKQLRLVGPSRGELRRARMRLRDRALRRWESPRDRCRELASYELTRGDGRVWLEELAALAGLTEEAVRHAAHDVLVDSRRATVETYPPHWPEDDPKLAQYRVYTVESGESLADVAQRFAVTVEALARANDLDPFHRLITGQSLLVPPSK